MHPLLLCKLEILFHIKQYYILLILLMDVQVDRDAKKQTANVRANEVMMVIFASGEREGFETGIEGKGDFSDSVMFYSFDKKEKQI